MHVFAHFYPTYPQSKYSKLPALQWARAIGNSLLVIEITQPVQLYNSGLSGTQPQSRSHSIASIIGKNRVKYITKGVYFWIPIHLFHQNWVCDHTYNNIGDQVQA